MMLWFMTALLALSQILLNGAAPLNEKKADIVFVVDRAMPLHNLNSDRWERVLSFIEAITTEMTIGLDNIRIGMVTFADSAKHEFHLHDTNSRQGLHEAIFASQFGGPASDMNMAEGLRFGRDQFKEKHGERIGVPNFVILITGGTSTLDESLSRQEAEFAKEENIYIISVGINLINKKILELVSSPPQQEDQSYFHSRDFIGLERHIEGIRSAIIRTLDYTSSGGSETSGGSTPSVTGTQLSHDLMDLVFVVDDSDNIKNHNPEDGSYNNWDLMIKFIVSVVDSLQIGLDSVRIGLLTFSDQGRPQPGLFLMDSTSKEAVVQKIRALEHKGGGANLADGLRVLQSTLLSTGKGARDGVPDVAIIVTTGIVDVGTSFTVEEQAKKAHDRGIRIATVGVSHTVDDNILKTVSSPPQIMNKNYFHSLTSFNGNFIEQLLPVNVEEHVTVKGSGPEEENVVTAGGTKQSSTDKKSSGSTLIPSLILVFGLLFYRVL